MIKNSYRVIALMSGTSLDGIDIIYASYVYDGYWTFKIHESETQAYTEEWKKVLSQLVKKNRNELEVIDARYSQYLSTVISDFISAKGIGQIDFVSSHGHTALHQPETGITYQIGNRQVLADLLNRKVICDFRVQDVALGGEGAPLVPIGDRLLFSQYDACLNLGGFANISFEDSHGSVAFDICPVNIVLNHYVSKMGLDYDNGGSLASKGQVDKNLLGRLNALAFYQQNPPKSLGLEWVEKHIFPLVSLFDLQTNDILRTFVEHIAFQIAQSTNPKRTQVFVTGGGAYNDFLMERIKSCSDAQFVVPENEIVDYKEALVFGLLGVLKDRDQINCLKSVTGATRDHSSGKVLLPKLQN